MFRAMDQGDPRTGSEVLVYILCVSGPQSTRQEDQVNDFTLTFMAIFDLADRIARYTKQPCVPHFGDWCDDSYD